MELTPTDILRQVFGYESFRPHQQGIVEAALAGKDVLAVMPTSAGKSICYQVPAIALAQRTGGLTVVVSPLISLMADQVGALRQCGVAASCLNSTLTAAEQADVLHGMASGALTLVYVAPERLDDPRFLEVAAARGIALLAVDEAHCISQWGNDFRPSYQRIIEFIDAMPTRPPVMALTATATKAVRDDIARALGLRDPHSVLASFDRPNLKFLVERPANRKAKDGRVVSFVREREDQSGIVYCSSRKAVEELCELLCARGIAATRYHAGLSAAERDRNQDDFLYDRARVMVATNAFGMGIDKSNVNYIVHYNIPSCLENYYQEAGRAGRDGTPAECLLLYSPGDVHTQEFLIKQTTREGLGADELSCLRERDEERLKQMVFYATTTDCLRSHILRYFGETAPAYCGNCTNCLAEFEETDATVDALKVESCVARLAQRGRSVGASTIVDIRAVIDELVYRGLLAKATGDYPTLSLTAAGADFMRSRQVDGGPLMLKVAKGKPRAAKKDVSARAASVPEVVDEQLYQRLVNLRAEFARKQQVPAYFIFSNATLADMCAKRPDSLEGLLEVSGVGQKKAEAYGEAFLAVLQA